MTGSELRCWGGGSVVMMVVGLMLLVVVSGGTLRQGSIQIAWFDPMENTTEADYYATNPFTAARKPSGRSYRPGRATNTHSCHRISGIPSHLRSATHMKPSGLSYFYSKYTEAYGIPVVGSRDVSDDAMKRACYVTRFLFADHSRVRQSYYARSGRVAVIGKNERTTDIPEHRFLDSFWDRRARGFGATDAAPVSTCGEENLLCLSSDRWYDEDIMIHELAHGVQLLGAKYAISGWQRRLENLYSAARRSGKWNNTYAMSTPEEYFAEGTQSFFDSNPYYAVSNGIHNSINTQSKLRTYDPQLFQLVYDVFPCNNTYMLRCTHTREEENAQQLRMNCDLGGGGTIQPPVTTTPSTTTESKTTRAPRPPTATASSCTDNNNNCDYWAKHGYCQTNAAYMKLNCRASCNLCGHGASCTDNNNNCAYWAKHGYCQTNAAYMKLNCRASCNLCGHGASCTDNNNNCDYWAKHGYCQTNAAYMKLNCRASCNLCGHGASCTDNNNNCDYWAKHGYCQTNAAYMKLNCRASCNLCGHGANCQDEGEHCDYWSKTGQCTNRADYMLQFCKRSCNVC